MSCGSRLRWRTVALCALALACQRDARKTLERADRLLATGQHKQAIVEYQSALERSPNARAERGLGLAYEALAAYGLADRHLTSALEARPEDLEARVALARVSTHFGRYAKARNELLLALEQEPDCEPALLLLGLYSETRAQLQRAIELIEGYGERQKQRGQAPSHATALVLADLLARNNRAEDALASRRSVRLAPLGNAKLTLDLGRAAAERGSHELARALLLPFVARHPNETDAWQVLALSAIELGKLAEAHEALQRLDAKARDPEVRLLAARLALANGLETEPTAELRALLSETPPDQAHTRARLTLDLAGALVAQRRYEEARAELDRLRAEQPGNVEASLSLAELSLSLGRYSETVQVLSALTDQHGQLARAYVALGRAELGLGRLEAAEAAFRRLWELSPHEPDPRYWLAAVLWRRGLVDQGRRLLEGNLERFPAHLASLQLMARLHQQGGGIERARAFWLEHGQKHPASAQIASAEGDWLLEHGDTERALAAYRRALVHAPSHFAAVSALTRFYAQNDKLLLARAVLDSALAHDPKDLRVLLLAARLSSDGRRYDEARQYGQRAVESFPDHPAALAALASIEAEGFRDFARARQLAERAYAAAPSSTVVLDAAGWVAHLTGDSERAVSHLSRAADQDRENPRLLYHLGAALLGAGRADAAHARFERVLGLDPTFPMAREIRTVLARR